MAQAHDLAGGGRNTDCLGALRDRPLSASGIGRDGAERSFQHRTLLLLGPDRRDPQAAFGQGAGLVCHDHGGVAQRAAARSRLMISFCCESR